MAKYDLQYAGWYSYTLQCGTIMTLISPDDCTLQCGMWHDSEFTKWQHHAMWCMALGWHAIEFARLQHPAVWHVALGSWHWIRQVALGCLAIEFAQTSAILEFYIWFRFRPYHRSRHDILHQSAKFIQIGPPSAEKMTSCQFSRWRMSAILDFRGPIMGSLKSLCTTSYWSSVETIALNCLGFGKIAFFAFWRQTDEQMYSIDALSHCRCHEQRLNNVY